MALTWAEGPQDTVETEPAFCVFYAGAKCGKTSLGSEFPVPLYVRTGKGERAPSGVTMKSFGVSESYQDVIDQIDWMLEAEHDMQTFLLDSADGLEQMIHDKVCRDNNWKSLEEPGYGKGFTAVKETWPLFVKKLLQLKEAGFYVVVLAHQKVANVPGVSTEGYKQWSPNLSDYAVGQLVDAACLIGYMHPRVSLTKDDLGFKKTNTRAQGGAEIVIEVQGRGGYIAGNRFDIEKSAIPFKRGQGFSALNHYFQRNALAPAVSNEDDDAADAA